MTFSFPWYCTRRGLDLAINDFFAAVKDPCSLGDWNLRGCALRDLQLSGVIFPSSTFQSRCSLIGPTSHIDHNNLNVLWRNEGVIVWLQMVAADHRPNVLPGR